MKGPGNRFGVVILGALLITPMSFADAPARTLSPVLSNGELVRAPLQPSDTAKPANAALSQWRGQNDGDPEFSTQIIRSAQAWSRLWRVLGQPMPATMDESREMAVFISVGKRPTGGFRPEVLSAVVHDGQLLITYTDGAPARDRYVTQAVTQPWVVVLLPAASLPLVFRKPPER